MALEVERRIAGPGFARWEASCLPRRSWLARLMLASAGKK